MIDSFSNWLRWNHTGRSLTGRDVETCAIPSFCRPPTFIIFPVPSIPFLFLSLALLLLVMFYQRKSHGLHHHKLGESSQYIAESMAKRIRRTYLFEIRTANVHLTQESVESGILPLVTPSPSIPRPAPLSITTIFGQSVNSPARDSNRNKPVPNLSHDNTSIGPPLSLSSNGG